MLLTKKEVAMRRFSVSVILILVFLLSIVTYTRGEDRAIGVQGKRLALVIGNGAYKTSPLKNSVNDAQDMARILDLLGFEVIHRENASQRTMGTVIREFGRRLRNGGVGLFYFAGHGMQLNGRNYLIPVDAKIESESDVVYESVDAGRVLGKMKDAGNELNIVILDACRDNPFARSFRSSIRGLARMDAPTGSILSYATSPGEVANDGKGRNGIYTSKLLKHIVSPGLSLEEIFKRVRVDVMNTTSGKQVPWESTSLIGTFYFAPPIYGNKSQSNFTQTHTVTPKLMASKKQVYKYGGDTGYKVGTVKKIFKDWRLVVVQLDKEVDLKIEDRLFTFDRNGNTCNMTVKKITGKSISALIPLKDINNISIGIDAYIQY